MTSRKRRARSTQHRNQLPLVLRLALLRQRPAGQAALVEQGYALAVAIIAVFVLLLGVAAMASRGQLGFIGQVFQVQNRQARDVAESAIVEFADTLNREPNRHLLIAGTAANWSSTQFRNICTALDDTDDSLIQDAGGNPVYQNPQAAVNDFLPSQNTWVDRGNGRSFRVESVKFLNQQRQPYVNLADGTFLDAPNNESYGTLYRSGAQRSLIRITVLGRLVQNNRTSTARVAREFEVVPKCCNRSFGQNLIGGVNWGRDSRGCLDPNDPGEEGIIAGMNGGLAGGSNNNKPIIRDDGTPITQASCWSGNETVNSDLNGTPNTTCTGGTSAVGSISFVPTEFDYQAPDYSNPDGDANGDVVAVPVPMPSGSGSGSIYFDVSRFNNSVTPRRSGMVLRLGNGTPTMINGTNGVTNTTAVDPCYTEPIDAAAGKPYYTVNCQVTSIDPTGSKTIFIDTSSAKINIFFVGNGAYGVGTGGAGVFRIHNNQPTSFRTDLTTTPVNCTAANPADCNVRWPDVTVGTPITQTERLNTFLELCADRGFDCDLDNDGDEEYSVRRLLNFYTDGTGTFNVTGNSSGLAFNIYAPNANVIMNGGGQSANFMGQIWTNNLTFNGNIKIQTFQGGSVGTPGLLDGIPLVDFIARSFTQASGF